MKLTRQRRLWQIECNITVPENIRQALDYYEKKYGETFTAVAMQPELRMTVLAETCHDLKLISDTSVTPGHLRFVIELENGI